MKKMYINAFWKLTLVALVSVFALGAAPFDDEDSTDWPKWRGQNQDGKSTQTGVFNFEAGYGIQVAWKKPLGSGYSGVSISDGRAVTMFSDSTFDYVIAFDAMSGDELWRFKFDSTYMGHDGSGNGPISTPVIDGNKVFALGARGHLMAIDIYSGGQSWLTNLTEHGAIAPYYGFATAPHVNGDVLIVELGATDKTISGFNKDTGELLWASGPDTVNYHSPVTVNLAGERQLLCIGNKYLIGLEPESGKMLWEFKHGSNGQTINPVVVGEDKIFLHHNGRESVLLQIKKNGGEYSVEELWTSRAFNFTYNTAVYHEGYLYHFSGRFLTCADVDSGKTVWKSRPPGDGFLILVDGYLVIQTKKGTMHIAKASPEGYHEVASLKVFDDPTWTPPSFANGRIYVRSLQEIASIEIAKVDQLLAVERPKHEPVAPNSVFAMWVQEVTSSSNKQTMIDTFLESQKSFPVTEGDDLVHFVYRGETKDLVVTGDMIDYQTDVVMERIPGTDFHHATFRLEPEACINYRFTKDFDQNETDPLNDNTVQSIFGPMSGLGMPKWQKPAHLEEPGNGMARGKIDTLDFESKILENTRRVDVYLPAGYNNSSERYPVIYINFGKLAREWAMMPNTLDNLIGKTVRPVIAVFIHQSQNRTEEYNRNLKDKYVQMLVEELVPHIDKTYRTKADAADRALIGAAHGGYSAYYTALRHPATFSMVAGQTAFLISPADQELKDLVDTAEQLPKKCYLDWGKYDIRSQANGFNLVESSRDYFEFLKDKGLDVSGGEFASGFGWASWRNRNDKILEAFFPM